MRSASYFSVPYACVHICTAHLSTYVRMREGGEEGAHPSPVIFPRTRHFAGEHQKSSGFRSPHLLGPVSQFPFVCKSLLPHVRTLLFSHFAAPSLCLCKSIDVNNPTALHSAFARTDISLRRTVSERASCARISLLAPRSRSIALVCFREQFV
jgi:hypothetical protein